MTEERCPERVGSKLEWDFCNLNDKPCLLDTSFDKCDTWEEMKTEENERV